MKGILYAVLAGAFVSLQSTFNARVSDKIGMWETNTIVMLTGLISALLLTHFFGTGNFSKLGEVNPFYLLGGMMGVIIVFSAIQSVTTVGIGYFLIVSFTAQIVVGCLFDSLGLFGLPRIEFSLTKLAGIVLIMGGALLYRLK